jgi:phospholipid/cholesterol/gamma-HCH transport system substrate-binding protein
MKQDNINYFYVGSFVLVMLVLLIVTLVQITGRTERTVQYFAYYNAITGIKNGTTITFGGYNIGYVDKVTPINTKDKGTKFKVALAIRRDWNIPSDSYASIVQPNLLSENQIEITEGKSAIPLTIGETIASKDAISLSKIFGDLSSDIKPLLNNLNSGLGVVSNDLAVKFPKITDNINNLLQSLQKNSDQLAVLTTKARTNKVINVIDNADDISKNLLQVSKRFIQTEKKLSELINTSNELVTENKQELKASIMGITNTLTTLSENVNSIIDNIDAASRNVNEFTRQIRNNPGVILSGKTPEDLSETK